MPKSPAASTAVKSVLHVGSGPMSVFDPTAYDGLLHPYLPAEEWEETRVDLDPAVKPDVVGSASDLPFEDESFDFLVCLACLEHLTEWDASVALHEFYRVLRADGEMILQVPDLELAAKLIVDGRACEVIYESEAGPVRALDLVYGHQLMAPANPLMSHRTGFTAGTLASWLWAIGFDGRVDRSDTDLWAFVSKIEKHEGGENRGSCLYQQPKPAE